jgi:hypothetical protein
MTTPSGILVMAEEEEKKKIYWVCARETLRSPPIDNSRNFPAHIYPNPFGTLGQLLKIPPFSAKKCHSAGGRVGPDFFF